MRLHSASGLAAVMNVENPLGLEDSSTMIRIDAFYRVRSNHKVDVTYYDLARSNF
jgi:hypothetical protein